MASYTPNPSSALKLFDSSGNSLSGDSTISVTRVNDTAVPTIQSVSTLATGVKIVGDTIDIEVKFSEAVTVNSNRGTTKPQLLLDSGPVPHAATYDSGSGTDTLIFTYTIQPGDTSNSLAYASTSALSLNGGTILDIATNPANLELPVPGETGSLSVTSSVAVDGVRPTFASAAVTAGTKSLVLTLDDVVSGTPLAADFRVKNTTGTTDVLNDVTTIAVSTSGTGSAEKSVITLTLTDYVLNNESYEVLYAATTAAVLSDANGNTVSSTPSLSPISVTRTNDSDEPQVLSVSTAATGTKKIGDTIDIAVAFDEDVTVNVELSGTNASGSTVAVYDGSTKLGDATVVGTSWTYRTNILDGMSLNFIETDSGATAASASTNFTVAAPTLTLETGSVDRTAVWKTDGTGGGGTNTLVFSYTVQSNDTSTDLSYTTSSALTLNGAIIRDNANNQVASDSLLPTPGETGSLSDTSSVAVDGVRPAFESAAVTAGTKSLVLTLDDVVSGTPLAADFTVKNTTGNTAVLNDVTTVAVSTSGTCLLYTSPSPRDGLLSRMPSSA